MHHGNPKISRDRDPVELRAAVRAEGGGTGSDQTLVVGSTDSGAKLSDFKSHCANY